MSEKSQPELSKSAFAIIFAISVSSAVGNTGLVSVLPAIGRSIGIPDPLVAAVFALSALGWVVTSPFWARASDRYGRKRLILIGLGGFLLSMILCAIVVSAGLRRLAPPMVIFGFFLAARSLFGFVGSASNPSIQAYVAERTTPAKRTQAISSLAGAFGVGTVVGPFLAPLFILPGVGLAGPLYGFALIAGVMLVVVWRYLPEERSVAVSKPAHAKAQVKGPPLWRDPRVSPFLLYGFVTAVCQTGQSQSLGFLIIDKLQLDPTRAQSFISTAMMFGAVAGLLAQWGIIRMFKMTPRQLLRWGVGLAAIGNLIVGFAPNYVAVVAGFALSSLAVGFARPGFTAGASLAVNLSEQARVAGTIAAVNGINLMFAPLFVTLYERNHTAPFVLNFVALLAMLVFTIRNPTLRDADPKPATRKDTVTATLERVDEGAV